MHIELLLSMVLDERIRAAMLKLERPRPLVYSDKMSNYEFIKMYS